MRTPKFCPYNLPVSSYHAGLSAIRTVHIMSYVVLVWKVEMVPSDSLESEKVVNRNSRPTFMKFIMDVFDHF
jgi:hypothetical protein